MNEILTRTRGDITTEELLKIKEARIKELEDQLETPQVIFLKEQIAECNELMSKQSRDMELLQAKLDKAVEALEFYANPDTWQCGLFERDSKKDLLTITYDTDGEGQVCGKRARETLKELEGVGSE